MPDDQYPTGPPQDPESAHFVDSQLTPPGTGAQPEVSFEPLPTPAFDDAGDQATDVVGIGGGQYPDDMFGVSDSVEEVDVTMPGEAVSGGLADVQYAVPGEAPAPLPPPAEPQNLADISIDPLPTPPADLPAMQAPMTESPVAAAGGDMFSVDELADEPAAAAPVSGGDMFSVDDLMDDPASQPVPDSLSTSEPLATPEPLAVPEPLAIPEPLAMPEPLAAPESLAAPEPLAMPEPLSASDVFSESPPEPLAMPEPLAAPEPTAGSAPLEPSDAVVGPYGMTDNQVAMTGSDFSFSEPAPEPFAAADQPVAEHPEFQSEPVVEPLADQTGLGEASEPTFEPLAMPEPTEAISQPEIDVQPFVEPLPEPEQADVVNPYAEASNEAEVLDPSMSFEVPDAVNPEADGDAPAVVNPYAEVSNEAEVLDPSMSFQGVESVQPEAAPEVFERTDPDAMYGQAPVAEPVDPFAAPSDAVYGAVPGTYSESTYGDVPTTPLPETGRTQSVAPPGMEGMAIGGLVVAGSKRSSSSRGKGKGAKLSMGKKKKSQEESPTEAVATPEMMAAQAAIATGSDQAYVDPGQAYADPSQVYADPGQAYADPNQVYADPGQAYADPSQVYADPAAPVDPYAVAAHGVPGAADPNVFSQPADPYAAVPAALDTQAYPPVPAVPAGFAPVPGVAAGMPPVPPAAPPADTGKKGKKLKAKKAKTPKAAKATKPPKAAKQGASMADKLLGPVEPGQRHKFLGIPIGKPAPTAEEQAAAAAATEAAAATVAQPIPAPDAFAPVAPVPAPLPEQAVAPMPVEAAPFAGAEVINTVEATAHARGKKGKKLKAKKAKTPKAAKAPKPPKAAKQGASMADKLLGPVEPGQRHKFLGIPIGKPAPTVEEQAAAEAAAAQAAALAGSAQPVPAPQQAIPAPLPQQPVPDVAAFAPNLDPPVEYAAQPAVPPAAPEAFPVPSEFPAPTEIPAQWPQQPPAVLDPAAVAPMTQPDIPDTPQHVAAPPVPAPVQGFPAPPPPPPPAPAPVQPDGPYPAAQGQPATFFPGGYAADFPGPPPPHAAVVAPDGGVVAAAAVAPQPAAEPMAFQTPAVAAQLIAPAPEPAPEPAAPAVEFAAEGSPETHKLAESGPRGIAMIVDFLLMGGLWMAIGKFAGYGMLGTSADGTAAGYGPIALAVAVLVVILYQGVMLAYNNGQTVGKRLAKIRVVREDGQPIDLGFAVARRLMGKSRIVVAE